MVILALALGIGANTAIFSVVDSGVAASATVSGSGRLVFLNETSKAMDEDLDFYPNFTDWRIRTTSSKTSASTIAAATTSPAREAERIVTAQMSSDRSLPAH